MPEVVRYYQLKPGVETEPSGVFRTREDEKAFWMERFVKGEWVFDPSLAIYIVGEDPDAEPITEAEAMAITGR